ncbi:MAG: hypothetical protein IKU26_03635 [Clostridia bacterium]|nr:hypothetical protein [Clostridia bacterium]
MGKMKFNWSIPTVCRLPIGMVLLGMCVMCIGNFLPNTKRTSYTISNSASQYETDAAYNDGATQGVVTDWRTITEYHQNRLARFLENIEGVGAVSVIVYCDRSSVIEFLANQVTHTQETEETDQNGGNRVIQDFQEDEEYLVLEDQGGNQRVVAAKELIPAIRSVCVVCAGGGKMVVQERITAAIVTLYDLSPNKIVVLPGK